MLEGSSVGDGYKGLGLCRILESCFSQAHPTLTATQLKFNHFTQNNSQHVSLLLLQLQLLRLLRLLLLLFLRRRSQPENEPLTSLDANLCAALNAPLEACSEHDVIQQHLGQIWSASTSEHLTAASDSCAARKDDGCWRSTGPEDSFWAVTVLGIPDSIANQSNHLDVSSKNPYFISRLRKNGRVTTIIFSWTMVHRMTPHWCTRPSCTC